MLLSHHSSQINPVIFYCCPCATNTALSFKPWAIKNEYPDVAFAFAHPEFGKMAIPNQIRWQAQTV